MPRSLVKGKPLVWGVTGRYASGKDEVTRLLCAHGYREINVDRIGHLVLEEKKTEAARLFGPRIFRGDGSIDRPALGRIVFRDRQKLRRLEALLHPRMKELVSQKIRDSDGGWVINAALFFSMGLEDFTDAVILVEAPLCLRLARARTRDHLGLIELFRRLRAQNEIVPQPAPENVDIYYIKNSRNREFLKKQLELILRAAFEA